MHVLDSVYTAADDRRSTVLIGLDISAAFDTISHDILINRLKTQFGICDSAGSWLHSYLSSRQQFVKLGQHSSAVTSCDSGVPQGSVLGPLLFTAYVAPIGELIDSFGVSYHHFAAFRNQHRYPKNLAVFFGKTHLKNQQKTRQKTHRKFNPVSFLVLLITKDFIMFKL